MLCWFFNTKSQNFNSFFSCKEKCIHFIRTCRVRPPGVTFFAHFHQKDICGIYCQYPTAICTQSFVQNHSIASSHFETFVLTHDWNVNKDIGTMLILCPVINKSNKLSIRELAPEAMNQWFKSWWKLFHFIVA